MRTRRARRTSLDTNTGEWHRDKAKAPRRLDTNENLHISAESKKDFEQMDVDLDHDNDSELVASLPSCSFSGDLELLLITLGWFLLLIVAHCGLYSHTASYIRTKCVVYSHVCACSRTYRPS